MNLQMLHKINTKTNAILVFVFFIFFIFSSGTLFGQSKMYTVVLDAGHGGKDPGKNVRSKKYYEKDIALNITLEVGRQLEKLENINVIYTRKKDIFIDLYERGRIANRADADLFVSIHCNAHNSQASGMETWVLGLHANKQNLAVAKKENEVIFLEDNYKENYQGFDPNSLETIIGIELMQEEYLDQSLEMANIVQKNMVKDVKRKDRGVKQAGFIVLHQTYMPSILIETGFITNTAEGAYLNSKKGQQSYANSITTGVSKYVEQMDLNSVGNDVVIENSKNDSNIKKDIVFKVQIASGRKKLETKSFNFKGLKGVERVKVGNAYKYYLGSTSNFTQIKEDHLLAKSKGYKSAFVVAFKNGEKISVQEALKTE